MNPSLNGFELRDPAGSLVIGAVVHHLRVSLSSALTGSLVVSGVVDAAGQPVEWVVAPGSTGVQAAPGAASNGGSFMAYSLTDPTADAGLAAVTWSLER